MSDPNFYLARSQTYRYVDSFRWIEAKHTITVGGEIRKMDINRDSDPLPNGTFAFTGLMTSQLTASGAPVISPANCQSSTASGRCIGSDFADFLLGYPQNTKIQYGDTATYFHNWGFIGYASDDWHMFPKFTVTYGVRYEAFTPPTEENGHIANLAVSPGFTQAQCVTPVATRKLRRRGHAVALLRPLQQLGAAPGDRLATAWKMVFRPAPTDAPSRLQHVLRGVLPEYVVRRDGQPASIRDG